MSTERRELKPIKCLCGRGHFVATHHSPDHPFGGGWYSYTYDIRCSSCIKKYTILEQGKFAVPVLLSDVKQQKELNRLSGKASDDFMNHDLVVKYIGMLRALLEIQPSVAAAFRITEKLRVHTVSYSTFLKNWKDSAIWVQQNIRPNNLPYILEVLGVEDTEVISMLEELDVIHKAANIELEPQGEPLVDDVP